mmetsp:Transcript_1688/g.3571  ORF Transcript_1688/g.3571 Transcript_1688/m.3571 type:complete len:104 (+) Transcript_1688:1617-1928(+)
MEVVPPPQEHTKARRQQQQRWQGSPATRSATQEGALVSCPLRGHKVKGLETGHAQPARRTSSPQRKPAIAVKHQSRCSNTLKFSATLKPMEFTDKIQQFRKFN